MSDTPSPASRPSVALIVLNWNGRDLLAACLPALYASTYSNFEVIVVDNGSEDDSIPYLKATFPAAIILPSPENLGFPRGMNLGLRYALAQPYEIVVSVNNDVVVSPTWLAELVAGLTATADIGIAGCKLLYPDGRTIQHAGGRLEQPRGFCYHLHQFEEDQGQVEQVVDVAYVTGAALAVKTALLRKIGLFDESFGPFYFEEVDLCFRARAAGYRIVVIPRAVALHHESQSVKTLGRRQQLIFNRNRLHFLVKHTSPALFSAEFVPAELAAINQTRPIYELFVLENSYLSALKQPDLPPAVRDGLRRLRDAAAAAQRSLLRQLLDPPARIEHRELTSSAPLIGPLVARLRNLWNNVAARWYVRLMFDQQEGINQREGGNFQILFDAHDVLQEKIFHQEAELTRLRRRLADLEKPGRGSDGPPDGDLPPL